MKQVILVNDWLGMPQGKLLAQVSHASMAPVSKLINEGLDKSSTDMVSVNISSEMKNWLQGSFTKLILSVRSEQEWLQVKKKLDRDNIEYFEIIDSGLTVFDGVKTHTCTGVQLMSQKEINKYFGHLPLKR